MAGLKEQAVWENEIYQIEENDPVHGGEEGITNKPAKQLANRTLYLRNLLTLAGQKIVPKIITATSTNHADATGHSHAIDHATTGQKGIVQLTNDTGLDSEALALTAKAGKKLAQEIAKNHQLASSKYTAQDASTSQKGLVQLVDNLTSSNNDKALTAKQGKTLNDKIKYIYNIVKSNNIPVNLDLTSRDQIIAEMGGNYQGVGVYRFTFHNLVNHNITGLPLGDIKGAVAIELEVMGGFSRMSCQYLYANRLFFTHVDWNKPTLTLRWYEVISQNADSAVYLRNTEKNRTNSIIITDDSVDMSRDLDGRKTLSNYEVRVGKHLKSIYRTHLLTNKNAEIELSGKDANDTWKRFLTMLTATGNVIVGTVPDNGRDRLQINGTVKATAPAADANNDQLPTTAWVNSALAPKVDKLVQQTLDLTSLDPDKWYPVIFKMPNMRHMFSFAVRRTLGDGDNPPWGTHDGGFTAYCEWITQPSGWGTYVQYQQMRVINQFTHSYCEQSPILKIGQISQANEEYVYLRGGTSYTITRESDVVVELGSNGYTWQLSSYSEHLPVLTSYDANLVPKTNRQALQDAINTKANQTTTLAGYGITDFVVTTYRGDLNTLRVDGIYSINSYADAQHMPVSTSGHVTVIGGGPSNQRWCRQIYKPHYSGTTYERWQTSNTDDEWSEWVRTDGVDWVNIRNKPVVSRRDYSRTVRGTNANWDSGTSQNISVTGYVEIRPDGKIEQHFYFHNFRVWWFGVEPTRGEHAGPKIPVQLWTAMPNKVTYVSGHFSRNIASGIPAGAEATEWNHPIWAFEEQGNIKDRFSLYARRLAGGSDERIDMYIKVEGY